MPLCIVLSYLILTHGTPGFILYIDAFLRKKNTCKYDPSFVAFVDSVSHISINNLYDINVL